MGRENNRRGKVTPENKVEAAKLKEIWTREKPRLQALGYGSQEAFGDKFGIGNQSAVGFFLNGQTALSLKAAKGFAQGLNCRIEDFSPRLASMVSDVSAAIGWPFPGIEPERFQRLTPEQRIEVQGVVRERLDSYERQQQQARQGTPDLQSKRQAAA